MKKQIIHHEEHEEHEEFWPLAKRGGARRMGCTVPPANRVAYEAINSAIAFFMSFVLQQVKMLFSMVSFREA